MRGPVRITIKKVKSFDASPFRFGIVTITAIPADSIVAFTRRNLLKTVTVYLFRTTRRDIRR